MAGQGKLISLAIFMLSMILLYGASATYHAVWFEGEAGMVFKRIDHMMIFVLIAGSYTPVCICALGSTGKYMLTTVWILAFAGMIFKLFWVTCPKWLSSVMYISIGWIVVFALPQLITNVNLTCFSWLLAGGIMYTIGGVIYALKLIKFNSRNSLWGSHEIFHLFVMAGSLCHYISMFYLFTWTTTHLKVRGFLLQPLLRRLQIYCNDASYTMSTGVMFGWFPPYSII